MSRPRLPEPTPMCRKCGVQRHRHDDVMRIVAEKREDGVDIGPKPHAYVEPEEMIVRSVQTRVAGAQGGE